MTKTITTISLDVDVKEKAKEILRKREENLSENINNHLKEIIKREVKKDGTFREKE